MKLCLNRLCVVVGLLVGVCGFDIARVGAVPIPAEFPHVWEYPEFKLPESMIDPGQPGFSPRHTFYTLEGLYCGMADSEDGVTCSGHYADYIPWKVYVRGMTDRIHSPLNKCLYYTAYSNGPTSNVDTFLTYGDSTECAIPSRDITKVLPVHHKVTYLGSVCGEGDNHLFACAANTGHGFVLLPNHQSWAY